MRRAALALVALGLLAGCGEDSPGTADAGPKSDRLVDLAAKPPLINALDIDPRNGDFLLTTNRGFFRIDPKTDRVEKIQATVSARGKTSPVGTFLYLMATEGKLIGSGHPDDKNLPSFLGFIESTDGGRSWTVLSRLGEADLHKIELHGSTMYAFDAVLGAMLVSDDGGRTFTEEFTPRGLIIDFVVDPKDRRHWFAATEEQLHETRDGGRSWRPVGQQSGTRLAWPAPGDLFRATKDGIVEHSADAGSTWHRIGQVAGEPYKFKAIDSDHLYLALSDGTITETTDGGKTWKVAFKP